LKGFKIQSLKLTPLVNKKSDSVTDGGARYIKHDQTTRCS